MTNISFACDWGKNSSELLERYRLQTPKNKGIWKSVKGVESHELADVIIVLDNHTGELPKGKPTLQVTREPDFIKRVDTDKYSHSHSWKQGFCGLTWWLEYSYDQLTAMPCPKKESLVSCIVSAKHQHRLDLLKTHTNQINGCSFDLFGRGLKESDWGDKYKGTLNRNGNCKWDGLASYQASIVMENSQQENYWTEKLGDALLSWTVPIYWGCPNISDYFENSILLFNDLKSVETIQQLEAFINQISLDAISSARQKVLNEYNLWEIVHEQVSRIF